MQEMNFTESWLQGKFNYKIYAFFGHYTIK